MNYQLQKTLAAAFINGGETAVRLFVQLFGCEPCPKCDYIKKHCRCGKEKRYGP